MALDSKTQAALALHRFGMGPRAGSIAALASDPRGALLAELDRPSAGQVIDSDLMTSAEAARATYNYRQERKAARLAQRIERETPSPPAAPSAHPAPPPGTTDENSSAMDAPMRAPPAAKAPPNSGPGIPQKLYLEEAKVRINSALGAEIGFVERLVWFWSNHFCISADKGGIVRATAGAFEREAIRPQVVGHFADMLIAVEQHPAMLIYLDNGRSIGPRSIAGLRQGKGLNENLAREILELHTLGVRTVYTQTDVTSFANVITGWTLVPVREPAHGGEFSFNARMHQPGDQVVIGQTYPDAGIEQGRAVLSALAKHPATATHVAAKLARHFVADTPPPSLISRLAKRFRDTEGDLKEVARTLVTAPEAWSETRSKLKRPSEWIVGALRATGVTPPDVRPVIQAQNVLGEPLWRPPAPKGFPDDAGAWLDGIAQRLDVANQLARRVAALVEPDAVVDAALGPLASEDTRRTIKHAESRPQALALLLMAPEFQRR